MKNELVVPTIRGAFRHVLHPPAQAGVPADRRPETTVPWYINDHCFLVLDHEIHWFGITNPYPASGNLYGPGSHRHIGHAVARQPFGPWQVRPHAFALPEGTSEGVGACFVVPEQDGFLMLYGYNTGFSTARSRDLDTWQRRDDVPVIDLGQGTRDPCVLRLADGTYLLYAVAGHAGRSAVVLAASSDLVHWRQEEPALLTDIGVPWGALESPFVHRRGRDYYLFVNHSHRQYEETLIFRSRDPRRFDWQNPLCTLFAHAAELFTWQGRDYLSHCGIEDRHWDDTGSPYGLWLAELDWLPGGQEDTE